MADNRLWLMADRIAGFYQSVPSRMMFPQKKHFWGAGIIFRNTILVNRYTFPYLILVLDDTLHKLGLRMCVDEPRLPWSSGYTAGFATTGL